MKTPKKLDKDKHSHLVTVRLNDDEFEQVSALATRLNLSKSAIFRIAVFNSKTKAAWLKNLDRSTQKATIQGVDRATVLQLINEINRVGTNINQIAHKANKFNNVPHETRGMLKQTIKILDKVLGVLGCRT